MKAIENKSLSETIYFKELSNGIRLFYFPKKDFTKKYAIFTTNYGSINNRFRIDEESEIISLPEGIAHFLEHKLFEDEEEDIFTRFAQNGAFVNAYTNFNQTSYLFYSTDNFYDNLDLLVKFVQNPYITDENVEKEKGIIAQEIEMYVDNPKWRVFFNCLKGLYHNHPVRIDIAGTVDSIMEITKDELLTAYRTFYNPSNMVLFAVGDLDMEKVVNTVESAGKKYEITNNKVSTLFDNEPREVRTRIVEDHMSTSKPLFYLGIKDNNLGQKGAEAVKKDIITNIILDMLFSDSSDFYHELYDKGLIDKSFGAYYTGKDNYGHSFIIGQTQDPKLLNSLILEVFKDYNKYINNENFLRIKKKEIGQFLMGFNSIEFIANNLTDLYFQDFLLIDYLDVLNSIDYKDIEDRLKEHFDEEYTTLSIIWPNNGNDLSRDGDI